MPDLQQTASFLDTHKQQIAAQAMEFMYHDRPGLQQLLGEQGRKRCREDTLFHLDYLHQAIHLNSKNLFANYLCWAHTMMAERGISADDLIDNQGAVIKAVEMLGREPDRKLVAEFIGHGIEGLQQCEGEQFPSIVSGDPLAEEARAYLELLLKGDRREASSLIVGLADGGTPVIDIYEHIFQKTQYEVGNLWQSNKISVAREHYCTAATQLIMAQLYGRIFTGQHNGNTLLACSVSDELHEIGIRMVADMFEMDGWNTHYLGSNMPMDDLVEAIRSIRPNLLAVSATLLPHIGYVEELIARVRREEEFRDIRVLVGGYPFRIEPGLWRKVGADASASTAREAIETGNKLCMN